MAAIGKGDWVQALMDGIECPVREGQVFCIEAVFPEGGCLRCGQCLGLHLYGVPTPYDLGLLDCPNEWPSCVFKPLGGNAKTLTAPPARVTEDA